MYLKPMLVRLVATEPQWQNELRWARNELRKEGLLDMSAERGQWRPTQAGLEAAGAVEAGDLSEPERLILANRRREPAEFPMSAGTRTDLLKKLQMYTHSMPIDDLEMLVEIAWAVRKRSVPLEVHAA